MLQIKCPRLGCNCPLEGETKHNRMVKIGVHFMKEHGILLQYGEAELITMWADNIAKEPSTPKNIRKEDNMT